MKRVVICLLVLAFVPAMLSAFTYEGSKPTADLFDADITLGVTANDTVVLDSNHVWILKDGVFVDSGMTLVIEPGTIIKGEGGTGTDSKFLCVARGGKIHAEGTPTKPIIFTGVGDDIDDPYDVVFGTNGLWGGLLVLGKSYVNTGTGSDGTNQIEGIDSEEPRGNYGGGLTPDSLDNSGVIKYVSIRHGGTEIGSANEINGLTLGAVGAGTTIEYVEVYNNYDDGVEWFGGTVNTSHMVVAFCGDDAYDYDEGFRGNHQFWFVIQDPNNANRCGEHDGATGDEQGVPFSEPIIYNATYIGAGIGAAADNDHALKIRDNAGGHYNNSIITEITGDATDIEGKCDPAVQDSRDRLDAGDLTLEHMVLFGFGDGTSPDDIFPPFKYDCDGDDLTPPDSIVYFARDYMIDPANNNTWDVDPLIKNTERAEASLALDPRLDPASPANVAGNPEPADPFYTDVSYKGAFPAHDPMVDGYFDGLWVKDWTNLWQRGHLVALCGDANNDGGVNVSDAVWTINFVFVTGSPAPFPFANGDTNCDGQVNVSDAVWTINFVFVAGSPAPCDC